MSRSVRVVLLAGCGLVAALEARQAERSLSAGLAGAYTTGTQSEATLADAPLRERSSAPLSVLMLLERGAVPVAGWSAGERR